MRCQRNLEALKEFILKAGKELEPGQVEEALAALEAVVRASKNGNRWQMKIAIEKFARIFQRR